MPNPTRSLTPDAMVAMFPYKARRWNAQTFIGHLERRVLAAREFLDSWGWLPMIEAFEHGKSLSEGVRAPTSEMLHHHLRMTTQECAVQYLWNRGGRVILEIHPGLTPHLQSSSSDKFPPMVLKHLTHANPLVYLGSPIEMRDSADKPMRLIAWFVVGISPTTQYLDTTDDRAVAFHVTAVSEVLSDDGTQVEDLDYSRITLPVTGKDATVSEIIEAGLDGFAWDPAVPNQTGSAQRTYIEGLFHVIVPHMLYLVSQNLETKPKPFTAPAPPRRNKWDRKQGGGKVDRHLIGFTSGPTLAALDHWEGDEAGTGEARGPQGARKPVRAHVRRAHFHTYRIGTGRTERTVKWLAPIPVNADGSAPITTVVKVK